MSIAHLENSTGGKSVVASPDANDSGFSEVCHASEGEDATWSRSRSAGEHTATGTETRNAVIQRSSTPNKYTQGQYTVPNGMQFYHTNKLSRSEICLTETVSDSAENTSRDPVPFQRCYRRSLIDASILPHVDYRTFGVQNEVNTSSTGKSSDGKCVIIDPRRKNYVYDVRPYIPHKKPDISDGTPTSRLGNYVGNEALNLIKSVKDDLVIDKPYFNKTSVAELLAKGNTATVPVLDPRRQTMNNLDHLINDSDTFRPVTTAHLETPTHHYLSSLASSIKTALGPGRIFRSPVSYTLSSFPQSFNVLSSSLRDSPSPQSRLSAPCLNGNTGAEHMSSRIVGNVPYNVPNLLFKSTLPVTTSTIGNTFKEQPLAVCLASRPKPGRIAEETTADIIKETKMDASCSPTYDSKTEMHDICSIVKLERTDCEEPYTVNFPDSLTSDRDSLTYSDKFLESLTAGKDTPTYSYTSDEDLPDIKPDVNNNQVRFGSPYSDISCEESHSDNFVTSESSCDETTRAAQVYGIRKTRKFKRKSLTPKRSPDKRDPRFKGVTIWLQTEFKNGNSQLHLSAFYSNVKVGVAKPRYSVARIPGISGDYQSCSEAEGYSTPTPVRDTYGSVKTCASCRTRRTPLWRDAEDGTPLCNACGIRYKKYRLRCSRCWFIPKKDIKTYPNCPACGAALRYSFHRKAW